MAQKPDSNKVEETARKLEQICAQKIVQNFRTQMQGPNADENQLNRWQQFTQTFEREAANLQEQGQTGYRTS